MMGRVLATDLSPAILALAQKNARQADLNNVQTLVADGEELPVEPASFDAVVRRPGLMFFPSEQRLGIFTTDDGWVGPSELLLTAAQRSG